MRYVHTQSFEALNQRAVAVVVDPIQSVKGKVVIDAFRCAPTLRAVRGAECLPLPPRHLCAGRSWCAVGCRSAEEIVLWRHVSLVCAK